MGGLTSLLLLLCIGVTVSTVLDLQKRIEGGNVCQNERQYHVKIFNQNNQFLCGGSLLNGPWVLTAAHCWESGMKVVLGAYSNPPQPVLEVITTAPVVYADDHDIMLLQLSYHPRIQHVDLPDCVSQDPPPIDATVRVAGHGSNPHVSVHYVDMIKNKVTNSQASVNLQCADLTVSPCEADDDHPDPDLHMFCGKTDGVKICGGDSGGGVEYNNRIYGVHKSSVKDPNICDPQAGFMNVCRYMDWIKEKTGIK